MRIRKLTEAEIVAMPRVELRSGDTLSFSYTHDLHDDTPVRMTSEVASMTFAYELQPENRPALELFFDLCLECTERLRVCSCHERGYN